MLKVKNDFRFTRKKCFTFEKIKENNNNNKKTNQKSYKSQ